MLKRNDFAEKRQFGRRQTNLRAWIRVAGRPPLPCFVKNLSEGGALLECEGGVWVPFSFRLTSEDKQIDRVCEIRHQTGGNIGVQFVAAAEAQEAPRSKLVLDADTWMGQAPQSRR